MSEFTFQAASEDDTNRLGAALAQSLPDGTVVALVGTLGAGKTRLVQAVAAAVGGIDHGEVTSPTFVLCQTYRGRRVIHHFDVYRLKDEQEFLELGPDEYFESVGLSFVEWGDKVDRLLPAARLDLSIEVTGPTQRQFTLRSNDPQLEAAIAVISRSISAM